MTSQKNQPRHGRHFTAGWALAFGLGAVLCLPGTGCRQSLAKTHGDDAHEAEAHHVEHKIVVTRPVVRDVANTQEYVCQIHSRRHIEICALESCYLEEIPIKEGQTVTEGDLLFQINPTLYKARLDSATAEADLAQIEYDNQNKLFHDNVVSDKMVALAKAKLARARAELELAKAEMRFTEIRAPFDGIIDRFERQHGSLIEEGEVLTTLSDNSVLWVYFNVPESRYLQYQANLKQGAEDPKVELVLANGERFEHPGVIGAIEADFDNETGNIPFRADFPNPDGYLRHGQTGTILLSRVDKDALVIPQRATFEVLAKRFAFVVDEQGVVSQREIEVLRELEDVFVVKSGLTDGDKIVVEGVRQVHDGQKIEFEYSDPEEVLAHMKYDAE